MVLGDSKLESYTLSFKKKDNEVKKSYALIAQAGKNIVGFALFTCYKGEYIYLEQLYVEPTYRFKDIASSLLTKLQEFRGKTPLYLEDRSSNLMPWMLEVPNDGRKKKAVTLLGSFYKNRDVIPLVNTNVSADCSKTNPTHHRSNSYSM